MSWEQYIDNIIAQTQDSSGAFHCDKAAIVGQDGSMWTSGPKNFAMTTEEINRIAQCFKSSDFSSMQSNGIFIGDVKYQFLRSQENAIFGKKKEHGAVTLQKTKTAVVIGHCAEGSQQGMLNKGVNVIAQYLEGMNM